ncbi:hypothetical protein LIER_27116 [Lithospermum erythrorhizon]|uniref:EF-hand domain-containing protein n=1 Tax=Lithospermum erythrorhizon TaxID=34254 RepID=A0AAV3RAW1_LITER
MTSSSTATKSPYTPSAPPLTHLENDPPLAYPTTQYNYTSAQPPPRGQYYHQHEPMFHPGTDPEIIRSFGMVDRDQNGFIDDNELQQALTSSSQKFSLRTIRLLIFLFKNLNQPSLKIGPQEFTALWSCLAQWRAIFEQFDKDRSGKINTIELRDALHSLGYAIPQSVLQVLISRYDNGNGHRIELNYDEFIECGMVVKGLTDKFKEKDPHYTGSAMLHYDQFLSLIIPFIVCD